MRHLTLVLGFTVIVLVLIAGCSTTSSKGSSVQVTTQPTQIPSSVQMTTQPVSTSSDLKIGDTAIIEDDGYKKSLKVTKFDGATVYFEITNLGDKAVPIRPYWFVDWGGVRHNSINPQVSQDLYPGKTKTSQQNLIDFSVSNVALEGKLYFCNGLGDQEACILIKS